MKLNKIFFMSLVAATGLSFTACSDDDDYAPGETVGTTNVSFTNVENKTLALTDAEFTITVQRSDSNGTLTVPLIVLHKPEVLTVPESVTFADGEATKDITIGVSDDAKAFVDYILMLTFPKEYCANAYKDIDATYQKIVDKVDEDGNVIKDEDGKVEKDTLEVPYIDPASTAYGYPVLQLTMHKEDYKHWGTMYYYSWFFEDEWESEVQYSEFLDLYKCDIFYDGYTYWFKYNAEDHTIAFTDDAGTEKTDTYFGYVHPSYGDMFTRWGKDSEYDEESGYIGVTMSYCVSAGSFGTDYDFIKMNEGATMSEE